MVVYDIEFLFSFHVVAALVVGYLDGTVRAFDLTRYRMFRKMSLPVETAASVTSVDIEIGYG